VPELSSARIGELVIGGSRANWASVGITFSESGVCLAGDVVIRCDESLPPGLHRWSWFGLDSQVTEIDGIETAVAKEISESDVHTSKTFSLQILGVDHVVINTPDLERTSRALEAATYAPLKRIRDAGNGMRQGFHRLGSVIVEIVSAPTMESGKASLWGFVLNVSDVHETARFLGPDVLSPPKPAVQKNRLISTFRSAAGLGVPIALMSDC